MPELYTTVEKEASAEFEEKRSLFIGHARPVKTEEEALAFVKEKKKEYADATHNVYAYYLKGGIYARYSDDNEPQGTAGMPVLDTIRKSGVEDVCVVVTRYFGGTLLGAGGLVRAYSHGAAIALEAAGIVTYEKYAQMCVRCGYAEHTRLMPLLSAAGVIVDGTEFAADVCVRFAIREEQADSLASRISEAFSGRVIPKREGERYDYR